MSDDYNAYFSLGNHTVVKFVNPNESLHSSSRDRLVRFKRATKAVNRSIKLNEVLHNTSLVGEKTDPRIYTLMTTLWLFLPIVSRDSNTNFNHNL